MSTRTVLAVRSLPRSFAYAAPVAPLGLLSLVTAFVSPQRTAERWERLATRTLGEHPGGHRRPTVGGAFGHAVMSVLLGLVAWVLILLTLLMVARGALYGVVDRGPYDDAWGGPSLAGAWLAHFAVSIPIAAVAVLLTGGVTRLHVRLTGRLQGAATPRWVMPVALLLCAATALFVFAWTRQA
jgi:hypothetical protein